MEDQLKPGFKRKKSDDSDLEEYPESTPERSRTPTHPETPTRETDLHSQSSTPKLTNTPDIPGTPEIYSSPQRPSTSGFSSTPTLTAHERTESLESDVSDTSRQQSCEFPDADRDFRRPPTPEISIPDWLPVDFDFSSQDVAPEDLDANEEDMESDVDEEEEWDKDRLRPVYTGAPLQLNESLVSILTLSLKYSLSGQLIQSILKLIDLHLPKQGNVFKKSLFLFKKYFSTVRGQFDYEYYCSKCYIKCEKALGCVKCHATLCCLVKLPMIQQLQAMFKRRGFSQKLKPLSSRKNPEGLSDVYDGKLYTDHIESKLIGEIPDLSGTWYWDGASVFESSKTSVWPLEFTINELPLSERYKRENLLVPALWCGPVKPYANIVIDKVYPELEKLKSGVNLEICDQGQKKVRFIVTSGTGDGPARDLMLNKVLQNGEFSCQKCEQKGEPREGYPGVRNFPYRPEEMKERDNKSFKRHGELAALLHHDYRGLKGPTSLTNICADVVRGTAIDSMHLVYGGAGKLNLKFFIDTTYNSLPCNVTKLERHMIDQRLLGIKPPHYLTRLPKGICDLGVWKTSMHKSMLLYFGLPVLNGIIKQEYFQHYATLVAAIQFLNSDCVTPECLEKANRLLVKYVQCFENLYGKAPMTLTVHLLLHLVKLVEEHGPLYTTSCFTFESVNGEILKLVHGTRFPEMQIATSIQVCLSLQDLVLNLPNGNPKTFCEDLLTSTHKCKSYQVGDDTIIGKWAKLDNIPSYLVQPLLSLQQSNPSSMLSTFNCLRRNRTLYAAESYQRSSGRDSSSVEYLHNQLKSVGLLKTFLRLAKCDCRDCSCECELYAVIQQLKVIKSFPTLVPDVNVPNTNCYQTVDSSYIIILTSSLQSVCVKMEIGNNMLAQRRNTVETE